MSYKYKPSGKLYGLRSTGRVGIPDFKEINIDKVGRKYIYAGVNKLMLVYEKNHYPQHRNGDVIARDDYYDYFHSEESRKVFFKSKRLMKEITLQRIRNCTPDQVFDIAKIMNIEDKGETE
ncbi:hypothetical protein ACFP65_08325 [Marinilactibacillus sp. GCM10026970]|uniref:hypothetical protein n=1 Tax=Marinilactibacillus sp. GCM10026970 TaxID=3252642 RepID=UPI00360F417F